MKYIKTTAELHLIQTLSRQFPIIAILGPRQCGKTTLAKQTKHTHYFDLENPRDLARFENPQLTLENLDGIIVIDEIQRKPALFPLLRYMVDNNVKKQKYLILGSASKELIQQSSESLAGRIAYYELGGFGIENFPDTIQRLWQRGGYPPSILAKTESQSIEWREQYITTFLEKDIPQLGIQIPASTLRKFWTMLCHYHGQILNFSELGRSLSVSDTTIKKYLDILSGTFMIRLLMPWYVNIGKRLVKNPKLYIRDSGIFHTLHFIENFKQLQSHPKLGASWEGFVIQNVARSLKKRNEELAFYHTHAGSELDLFWQNKGKSWGIECKYQDAPTITKSMKIVIKDLQLSHLWVIYPGKEKYQLEKNITVLPAEQMPAVWKYSG